MSLFAQRLLLLGNVGLRIKCLDSGLFDLILMGKLNWMVIDLLYIKGVILVV